MARTPRRVKLAEIRDDALALGVLRDRLADEIDSCSDPWLLVALAPQYRSVVKALREVAPAARSRVDEIAERRARRRAAAGIEG